MTRMADVPLYPCFGHNVPRQLRQSTSYKAACGGGQLDPDHVVFERIDQRELSGFLLHYADAGALLFTSQTR